MSINPHVTLYIPWFPDQLVLFIKFILFAMVYVISPPIRLSSLPLFVEKKKQRERKKDHVAALGADITGFLANRLPEGTVGTLSEMTDKMQGTPVTLTGEASAVAGRMVALTHPP